MTRPAPASEARRRRPRQSSRWVRLIDRAATAGITLGGVSVILAVLGIMVYLVMVVVPLFRGASATLLSTHPLLSPAEASRVVLAQVDEYRALGLALLSTGEAICFDAESGAIVGRRLLVPAAPAVTAFAGSPGQAGFALGHEDGSIRLGEIRFDAAWSALPGGTAPGDPAILGTVTRRLEDGGTRRVTARLSVGDPLPSVPTGAPIAHLDYRASGAGGWIGIVDGGGDALVGEVTRRTNLLTGREVTGVAHRAVILPAGRPAGPPRFVRVTGAGDMLYLAWPGGETLRFDLREDPPLMAETTDLAIDASATLTWLGFMAGEQSLVAGDSMGRTRVWFRAAREGRDAGTDGYALVPAHTLAAHEAPVQAAAFSQRSRSIVTGASDGTLILHYAPTRRRLLDTRVEPRAAILAASIAPKGDGLLAFGADGRATLWALSNPHPETGARALAGTVWYEGYPEPGWTWQSSSGTDDSEPKLSLVPLVFGTLKATLYSMLFAVPIALGAAIYTSEFLDRRYRATLKSAIEMMAALPSVVLGFLAALVLAPIVSSWVLAVVFFFGLAPVAALTAGYVWQALPSRVTLAIPGILQLAGLAAVIVTALLAAGAVIGPAERLLFGGDFMAWLDGRQGSGAPGIALLLWPVVTVGLLFLDRRRPWAPPGRSPGVTPGRAAAAELIRFVLLIAVATGLAWIAGIAGSALGFDPRGLLLGTYVQRNALVVGFVMGFAVIPIVYTLSEEALASVPQTLRSASLGCGATRWQTAMRVVVPVAVPGIFSALMVGLGRAVGETMIVLMAAGNTPLLDLNVFNGMRTLSANIAVELPEAVKDGTLYRVLFLAALLLFLITFAVNTLAEVVRQRFRRRAVHL